MKTLYLCYFGLREPLVQTQVLPYLREIQKGGVKISILTFESNPKENWTEKQIKAEEQKLGEEGIEWNFLTYHKRPSVPATLFDVLNGAFYIWRKVRNENIDILHARVHTAAMMAALAKTFLFGGKRAKLLFDIRGFVPEEYTDAGVWKENGALYKTVKLIEKWLFKKSDGFVVLTEKARGVLFPESLETGIDKKGRPVEVIPCCVDLRRFKVNSTEIRSHMRQKLGIDDRLVLVYIGSLNESHYMLNELTDLISSSIRRNSKTFAMILTHSDPHSIEKKFTHKNISKTDFMIAKLLPQDIPNYLSSADIAISFKKADYSSIACSPTKLAEYLVSSLPVIANAGVGDVKEYIEEDKVGYVISDFNEENYMLALEAVDKMLQDNELAERCKASAKKRFDLVEIGGKRYLDLYRRLLK